MNLWGFGSYWKEGATAADFWSAIYDVYEGDIIEASKVESDRKTIFEHLTEVSGNAYSELIVV